MVLRGWGVRVVVVGAVVAMLAGCTGDADPVVTPTPTPAPTETAVELPSPTPSPSPTELTEEEILAAIPERAQVEDFMGAVYFSQFFIELYPAMLTPEHDSMLFSSLSAPECEFCESSLMTAQAQEDASAYSEGGEFSWTDQVSHFRGGLQNDGYWYIEQPFEVTETLTYSHKGDLVGEGQGGSGVVTTKLEQDVDRWIVLGVNFEFDNA